MSAARSSLWLLIVCSAAGLTVRETTAQPSRADAIAALEWRSIGPANMGGRVTDIVGMPGDRDVFYFGGADGGVFRTTNGGVTFDALFTDQTVYSAGALAVAASDHNVIWLGTGEGDPRNSVSYGNGVYRSLDGGDTWHHLGLEGTERIKRIVVDPRNPDVAFVCALGREWGPNEERGVFKTTDGGGTWEKVLYVDRDTGCSDLALTWSNPRVLFAGMWTFRRRPWHFRDGGGATALYRSMDGGASWERLTKGLPKGPMARIGISIAQSEPRIVYVITEAKDEGTLFRSEDGGDSWRMINDDVNINFRPFYYSDIRVDPSDPNTLFSLSGRLFKSTDGGRTFRRIAQDVHGDHQSFWIDPMDGNRLLSGSDGGYQLSFDGGENWDIINNVALSQFYQLAVDDRDPYYVCGGLQDNGTWCGPSHSLHDAGILKDDWYRLYGGDGFYAEPVPGSPHLVYANSQGGNIALFDRRTGAQRRVHPYPHTVGSQGDAIVDHRYRFNWDAPIHISPHDAATVYLGGNVLFRSRDYGNSWEEISPDLTTDDPEKQGTSGGEIYTDNTAAEFHTTIITIAESRVQPGVIWVGTDDGNIQVTRDGGGTWTNVKDNVRGLPAFSWIAKIDASWHDAGTAYVAVDDHRSDDFTPHAFKTTDFGRSWINLAGGLPQDDYVKVIREDSENPDLLYVGMERGVYASWDGGDTWMSIRNKLPPVSVRDIKIHPRDGDVIIGTHGRGAFILDDATPLRLLDRALQSEAFLFPIRRATRWQIADLDANQGQRSYRAENPPDGALVRYYLREVPERPLSLVVTDAAGQPVRTMELEATHPGINRAVWDLRHDGPTPLHGAEEPGGFFGGPPSGPRVVPGSYTVTLRGTGAGLSQPVEVRGDPRVEMSAADFQQQFDALVALREMASQVNGAIDVTENLVAQLNALAGALEVTEDGDDNGDLSHEITAAVQAVKTLSAEYLRRPPPRLNYRQRPRVSEQIQRLMSEIDAAEAPPTEPQRLRVPELRGQTDEALSALNRLLDTTIADLNDRLGAYPRIIVRRPIS